MQATKSVKKAQGEFMIMRLAQDSEKKIADTLISACLRHPRDVRSSVREHLFLIPPEVVFTAGIDGHTVITGQ